jgi:LacI family transcriptional regulator
VITIRDVAREAGVSIATVSRVINDSARVNDETRRRVWDAASRLDFWPNGAARTLTTARTNAIGVLLPDLHGEFFSEVIRGIDRAARAERLQVLISSSHADTEGVLSAARSMRGRVDGLIVMAPERGSQAAIDQIRSRFPMVLLNSRSVAKGSLALSVANFDGAYRVARHVLSHGHRRVAVLKGPRGNFDAEERLRGYRKALREAGAGRVAVDYLDGDFSESSGVIGAAQVVRLKHRPTAVFAANDYMAIGLLTGLREAGVRVPQDIAVTGFDDIVIAQYVTPPLTTVRVDACDMGERAVRMLIGARGPEGRSPESPTLSVSLIIRESCGGATPRSEAASKRKTGRRTR